MSTDTLESLEGQLRSLYQEREFLHDRYGVSSADDIVRMVECLEAQLRDFYARFGGVDGMGDSQSSLLLERLRSLSGVLDQMYSSKSVELFIENDRPVLRAQWIESTQGGQA